MEKIINIHIKKLPEGVYLATSKDIQGLVAQGRTATEALEIARDVARKLIEAQAERSGKVNLTAIDDSFDYPLIPSRRILATMVLSDMGPCSNCSLSTKTVVMTRSFSKPTSQAMSRIQRSIFCSTSLKTIKKFFVIVAKKQKNINGGGQS